MGVGAPPRENPGSATECASETAEEKLTRDFHVYIIFIVTAINNHSRVSHPKSPVIILLLALEIRFLRSVDHTGGV